MDSILLTLNANNIKPKWLIVLYANNLLILTWLKPKIEPIINDKRELISNVIVQVNL